MAPVFRLPRSTGFSTGVLCIELEKLHKRGEESFHEAALFAAVCSLVLWLTVSVQQASAWSLDADVQAHQQKEQTEPERRRRKRNCKRSRSPGSHQCSG